MNPSGSAPPSHLSDYRQPRPQTYPRAHCLHQTLALFQQWLPCPTDLGFSEHTASLSTASKLGTNGGSRDIFCSTTPSSITNPLSSALATASAKWDVLFTSSSSVELISLINDVSINLLHGKFILSFIKTPHNFFQVWLTCLPAMTTACIFKDTLNNKTHLFFNFKISIFEICLHPINFYFFRYFQTSSFQFLTAGISKLFRFMNTYRRSSVSLQSLIQSLILFSISYSQLLHQTFKFFNSSTFKKPLKMTSYDSFVFFVEQKSSEPSLQRNNTLNVLNSTELKGDAEILLSYISQTRKYHHSGRLQWTNDSIRVWNWTTNCLTEPQWPQSSGKSF